MLWDYPFNDYIMNYLKLLRINLQDKETVYAIDYHIDISNGHQQGLCR
jgi:hypothetical protein